MKHCTNLWNDFKNVMLTLLGWASILLAVNTCKPSGMDSHTPINWNTIIPYNFICHWIYEKGSSTHIQFYAFKRL